MRKRRHTRNLELILNIAVPLFLIVILLVGFFVLRSVFGKKHMEETPTQLVQSEDVAIGEEPEAEILPEEVQTEEVQTEETVVQRAPLIGDGPDETEKLAIGIDVSRYQGIIDWTAVAVSEIEFAMIRVGYRTTETGEIVEDANARYNLQEATGHGIKAGVYFFSTAINEAEAIEEAVWVKNLISGYQITYPVVYDCEGYENAGSRQITMTKEERTEAAEAFLKEIHAGGYTPMFYSSKGELENDSKWVTTNLEQSYKMWISWYPEEPYPATDKADYRGELDMWQYTNQGNVSGVIGAVDLNLAYFGYETEAEPRGETAEHVTADLEALMDFEAVNENVTAKNATNLRNIPSQGEDSTVMHTLKNGEVAVRTGVSASGWSRVEYEGSVYYAVTSYLTTDLSVKTPEPDDGIRTKFTAVSENVTPKIEVNLRNLPSVTNPDAVVVATLSKGEVIRRTGVNEDYGWSRVEYNGQTLYCVSSYVSVVE